MQLLKKKIKLRECPCIFSSNISLKGPPSPLAHYTDEKNQALKLLFDTAAVDLVLQLDLWVRKCSNFISMIISNTLFQNLCSWQAYLEPCQFSMTELLFELCAKSCLFSQKISIIYVWKGFKYTSAAVSVSCIFFFFFFFISLFNVDKKKVKIQLKSLNLQYIKLHKR